MRPIPLAALALAAAAALGPASAQEPGAVRRATIPPVVERWAAAWNAGDPDAMAALFTEGGTYEDKAFQARFEGRDGMAAWVGLTVAALPGARVEVIDAFQADDRVAVRWTYHGTPVGFGPTPANGDSFAVPAATLFDLEGELIAGATDFYNLADLFRQVGVPSGPWVPPGP